MKLGIAITQLRKRKKVSQGKLAEMLDISQSYLSSLERGKKLPSLDLLNNVSKVLRVPIPLLFILSIDETDLKWKNSEQSQLALKIVSALAELLMDE